jgi:DNA repair exonuclease SbcCD ATPase subunit
MKSLFLTVLALFALSANAQQTNCQVYGNQVNCSTYGGGAQSPDWSRLLPQYQSPQAFAQMQAQTNLAQQQAELARQQAEQLRQQTEMLKRQQEELERQRAALAAEESRIARASPEATATTPARPDARLSESERQRAKAVEDRLARDTSK